MKDSLGPYRLIRRLGEGGQGAVYAAEDARLGRSVALKTLRRQGSDLRQRERLLREARTAASVSHPGICQVYEVGPSRGQHYIVMQLITGGSLAEAGARLALEQKVLVLRYMLDPPADASPAWKLPRGKPIVGLNTGCGARWTSRLWPERNWVSLARRLRKAGAVPLLLGGEQEHVKNRRIARLSGARYAGFFPIGEFVRLVGACDLVVTGVTFAAHVAIGLGKRIVLFNNIFNRHEFELYGQGEILEPEAGCTCYYAPRCTNPAFAPKGCMTTLRVETVAHACLRLLRP